MIFKGCGFFVEMIFATEFLHEIKLNDWHSQVSYDDDTSTEKSSAAAKEYLIGG